MRTGRHKHAILGALTWLTTIQGIPLLPSTGPARTAELLVTLARQQQQAWRGPTGVVKPQAPTLREQQRAVLAALPGVGPALAARLLDHVGGLRGALDADAAALRAVPGIGAAIATRLAALLRRRRRGAPGGRQLAGPGRGPRRMWSPSIGAPLRRWRGPPRRSTGVTPDGRMRLAPIVGVLSQGLGAGTDAGAWGQVGMFRPFRRRSMAGLDEADVDAFVAGPPPENAPIAYTRRGHGAGTTRRRATAASGRRRTPVRALGGIGQRRRPVGRGRADPHRDRRV